MVLPKKIRVDTENYLVFTNFLPTIILVINLNLFLESKSLSQIEALRKLHFQALSIFFPKHFFHQSLKNGTDLTQIFEIQVILIY